MLHLSLSFAQHLAISDPASDLQVGDLSTAYIYGLMCDF